MLSFLKKKKKYKSKQANLKFVSTNFFYSLFYTRNLLNITQFTWFNACYSLDLIKQSSKL